MKSRNRGRRLSIETLEDRRVPATWGVAWPDPQNLTVSFVPDGTSVEGESSVLYQTLNSELGTGNWETTILKALQTWAVNSNINIGLVGDGGEPIGTAGPAQGDSRFGDIRISAAPLPAGVAAITAPYNPSYGTYSGDMILNSNDNFTPGAAGGYDLFTVALHEAGHVFGFADSTSSTSFMYNVYQGAQTGLGSGAVPALQALYGGARNINAIDGYSVSTNSSSPVAISTPSSGSSVIVAGDIATPQTTNYYSLSGGSLLSSLSGEVLKVQTAGLSLLTPKVTVYDEFGNVVASATASSPLSGGVTLQLPTLFLFENYKIAVTGATGDVFSVGSYDLTVSAAPSLWNPSNPTAGSTAIAEPSGYNGSTPLTVNTTISQTAQNNVYSVVAPASTSGGLTVNIQNWGLGLEAPAVTVYNAYGIAIGSATASSPAAQSISLTATGIVPGQTYYISVQNGKANQQDFGSYQLSVTFAGASSLSDNFTLVTPWFGSSTASNGQTNGTLSTAATLVTPTGFASESLYVAIEGINTTETQQYYKLTTPAAPSGQTTEVMTVSVESLGGSLMLPWITVYNQSGAAVATQPLIEQNGVAVSQVVVPTTSSQYYIEVDAWNVIAATLVGNYYLEANFGNIVGAIGPVTSGTLAPAPAGSIPSTTSTFTVAEPEVYSYVLAGSPTNNSPGTYLFVFFFNSSGSIVSALASPVTLAESGVALLPDGTYTILIAAENFEGQALPSLSYSLTGTSLTDPIKAYLASGSAGATTGS